jgi:hypothetical protein
MSLHAKLLERAAANRPIRVGWSVLRTCLLRQHV